MLTFSPAQMTRLQRTWQTDQLLLSQRVVLARLQQQFPDFWVRAAEETHQRYYCTQAEKLVYCGMGQVEWLEKLLGLEYQHQCSIAKLPWLGSCLTLNWLTPADRLGLIDYLLQVHSIQALSGMFPYDALANYPMEHRLGQLASYPFVAEETADLSMHLVKVLRQGLFYALLKEALHPSDGWQTCHSDWSKTLLGIRHAKLQRSIYLQTHESSSNYEFSLKAAPLDEAICLYITVPLHLNENRIAILLNYLKAWCVSLEPATSATFRSAMTAAQHPEEEAHA